VRRSGGDSGRDATGTPEYMPPEIAQEKQADPRTDIYSLGATLFHMVTGRPPFEGQSPVEILMRMAEEIVADIGAELEEEYCCGICQLYFPVTDALYRYGACGIRVCEACKEDPRRTRCTVS